MIATWLGTPGYNPLAGQVESGKDFTIDRTTFNKLKTLGLATEAEAPAAETKQTKKGK